MNRIMYKEQGEHQIKRARGQPCPIGAKPTYLDVPVQSLEFHKIDTPTTVRIKDIYQSESLL
jgi:hypothetical protein